MVSIIIPVYNMEKYLERSIESAVNQTYRDIEIILVNDGSTDQSLHIMKEWEKKDNRIVVVDKKHCGLSDARNAGLNNARGEFIFFLDSDDCLHSQTIEYLLGLCRTHNTKIAGCRLRRFHDGDSIDLLGDFEHALETVKFDFRQYMTAYMGGDSADMSVACAKLYVRELFEEIRFPVGRIHEDEAVIYKLVDKAGAIVMSEALLYMYYVRANSITTGKTSKNYFDCFCAFYERDVFLASKWPDMYSDWGRWAMKDTYIYCLECVMDGYRSEEILGMYKDFCEKHPAEKSGKAYLLLHFPKIIAGLYKVKRFFFGTNSKKEG